MGKTEDNKTKQRCPHWRCWLVYRCFHNY